MQKVGNGSDADQCHSISRREERNHNLIKFKEVNKVSIISSKSYMRLFRSLFNSIH